LSTKTLTTSAADLYSRCRKRGWSWDKDAGHWHARKGFYCWQRAEEANYTATYTSWYLSGLVIHAQRTSKEALALNTNHSWNKDSPLPLSDLQRQVHSEGFASCNTEIWYAL